MLLPPRIPFSRTPHVHLRRGLPITKIPLTHGGLGTSPGRLGPNTLHTKLLGTSTPMLVRALDDGTQFLLLFLLALVRLGRGRSRARGLQCHRDFASSRTMGRRGDHRHGIAGVGDTGSGGIAGSWRSCREFFLFLCFSVDFLGFPREDKIERDAIAQLPPKPVHLLAAYTIRRWNGERGRNEGVSGRWSG